MEIKFIKKIGHLRALMELFDQQCFPSEMWQTSEEMEEMLNGNITGILVRIDSKPAGFSVILDEIDVADELSDFDPLFDPQDKGCYSYSVAVMPLYQGKGISKMMLEIMTVHARLNGAQRLTTHARTSTNWHERRANFMKPTIRRTVPDAWEKDGAVEYQEVLL